MPSASKKLMLAVLPGVLDTLTRPLRLNSLFMMDDLPTLERPTKLTSGQIDGGIWLVAP